LRGESSTIIGKKRIILFEKGNFLSKSDLIGKKKSFRMEGKIGKLPESMPRTPSSRKR